MSKWTDGLAACIGDRTHPEHDTAVDLVWATAIDPTSRHHSESLTVICEAIPSLIDWAKAVESSRSLSGALVNQGERIRELEAALTDMTRQRDRLVKVARRAIQCIERDLPIDVSGHLSEAIFYCESLTPADRARDAEALAGMAAADEADHEAKVDRLLEQADERTEFDPDWEYHSK